MEVISVGRRIRCPSINGGEGTIVKSELRRLLVGDTLTYTVVFDDGQILKALSAQELKANLWMALPESRSREACNEIWFQALLAWTRRQARLHEERPEETDQAVQQALVRSRQLDVQPGAAPQLPMPPSSSPLGVTRENTAREVVACARLMLARRGIEQAAVNCAQRIGGYALQVAWYDGPVEQSMYLALQEFKNSGVVAVVDLSRSISELTLRALITYIQETLYSPEELAAPSPELARILARVRPEAYHSNSLSAVYPPPGHAHSGVSYHALIRCAIDRWDARMGLFVDTHSSRFLLAERKAIFPDSPKAASAKMAEILARLTPACDEAESDLFETLEEEIPAAVPHA